MTPAATDDRRRRHSPRRLFFFLAALSLTTAPAHAQVDSAQGSARLRARELRVTRDEDGAYRVLEIMSLQIDSGTAWPLAVARLAELTDDVVPAGGDLDLADIRFARPDVLVLAGPDRDTTLELGFSYRIAANADALAFTSLLPTDHLGLSIARGSIAYRPDRRLALTGELGPAAMPWRRYAASDVSPGETYVIGIRRESVGLREKIVVLVVTAVLAGLTAYAVSRKRRYQSH